MRIAVTGGTGRLGRVLARRAGVIALSRAELDVTSAFALPECDAVINAAAYTDIDRAETERETAQAVNARGAGAIARACAERGIPCVQVSTDYVFDGAATRPYREDDPVAPLSVYGESKLAGERAALAAGATVVRTAWVFDADLRGFAARFAQPGPVEAPDDRTGSPTAVEDLADALLVVAARPPGGIVHVAGEGATTWYGFARTVANARGFDPARVIAIASPVTPARRPALAVLDCTRARSLGIPIRDWVVAL